MSARSVLCTMLLCGVGMCDTEYAENCALAVNAASVRAIAIRVELNCFISVWFWLRFWFVVRYSSALLSRASLGMGMV